MRILWSDLAKSNLKEIFYFYKDIASYKVAKSIVTKIIEKPNLLIKQPKIGQIEDNPLVSDRGFRYLVEGNYKIVYKVFEEENDILIATVFDTRRNPEKLKI